ncbi:hypothetical protein [Thiothrix lacustris]|uniref:hypothetical protein n=1 Tax=Thiothrix lacustris TaxID=525917 RepID=UPI0027E4B67D|nr:hypothetical protein [Thiothrix lacustris]WMP16358.1 hypothetical protein RCS87_13285 [Thiothrix lacustris]
MPLTIVSPTQNSGQAQGNSSISPTLLASSNTTQPQYRDGLSSTLLSVLPNYASSPMLSPLLQQIGQQIGGQSSNVASTPQVIVLSEAEKSILMGTYAADSQGKISSGQNLKILDGSNADKRLSEGDTLIISDAAGTETLRKTLSATDLYDLNFRKNMVNIANSLGEGWAFSENLVHINAGELTPPETRNYSSNNQVSTETVLERNNYWEVVQRGSNRYLLMRNTDNSGQPVQPSVAINDVFNNRQDYAFDCASPMRLLNLKATLETIGADDFDSHAGQLQISSWYDKDDSSGFDGGFVTKVRTAQAGEVNVDGINNLSGETALFDTAKGDALTPGSAYYFDLPGDNTSASQGWNAIYLGRNADDSYRFWSTNISNVNVSFKENTWLPQDSFKGYYLGAINVNPNTERLQSWDTHRSV